MLKYKGITLKDVNSMQIDEALAMYEYAIIEEAKNALFKLNISDYPSMSAENRRKLFKELRKQAYPKQMKHGISFSEFARKQKNGSI